MQHFFSYLSTILFPESAEARFVRSLNLTDITSLFHTQKVGGIVSLSSYTEPGIRALIHEAKFHRNKHAFMLLGALLQKYIETLISKNTVIVPIPLSPARMRARGYNQITETIRCALNTTTHVDHLNEHLLRRIRDTKPQTELRRELRLTNVVGAFAVDPSIVLTDMHILLIDDVATTGATLHAAKAAFLPYAPASITCIALAH